MKYKINTAKVIQKLLIHDGPGKSKYTLTITGFGKLYGCNRQRANTIIKEGVKTLDGIERVCEVFGIKPSKFIAMAEEFVEEEDEEGSEIDLPVYLDKNK